MYTHHRAYNGSKEDFKMVLNLMINNGPTYNETNAFSLERFIDWKYGLYPNRQAVARFHETNARLWFDGLDKLCGVLLSEEGESDCHIILANGFKFLFEDILKWTLEHWQHRSHELVIELNEHQVVEMNIAEKYGFEVCFTAYQRQFDLTKAIEVSYALPEGYYFVDMGSCQEYKAQRILRANAFEGKNNLTDEELTHQLEFYGNTKYAPSYHGYTDLSVKSPDGLHVAGCEALLNPWHNEAEIERVCTHSEYRRKGLSKAVIIECLKRLKEMGVKKAYITGYSHESIELYSYLGAEKEVKSFGMNKIFE